MVHGNVQDDVARHQLSRGTSAANSYLKVYRSRFARQFHGSQNPCDSLRFGGPPPVHSPQRGSALTLT